MRTSSYAIIALVVSLVALSLTWAGDPPPTDSANEIVANAAQAAKKKEIPRVSLAVARDRARIMQDIYLATLETIHHRYFHGERAVVPARAMEDVFRDMQFRHQFESRWISASLGAMSLDHEPKTEFEKHAAKKLSAGEDGIETIEDGYYRRAGSVALNDGCLRCHAVSLGINNTKPRFAGLVISIPVEAGAKLEPKPETTKPETAEKPMP